MAAPDISLVIAGGELTMRSTGTTTSVQKEVDEARISLLLPKELAERVKIVDWSHQPSSHYSIRMAADLVDLLSKQVTGGASAVVAACGIDLAALDLGFAAPAGARADARAAVVAGRGDGSAGDGDALAD